MKRKISIEVIYDDELDYYSAYVPELSAITQAANMPELLVNLKDAIELALDEEEPGVAVMINKDLFNRSKESYVVNTEL